MQSNRSVNQCSLQRCPHLNKGLSETTCFNPEEKSPEPFRCRSGRELWGAGCVCGRVFSTITFLLSADLQCFQGWVQGGFSVPYPTPIHAHALHLHGAQARTCTRIHTCVPHLQQQQPMGNNPPPPRPSEEGCSTHFHVLG